MCGQRVGPGPQQRDSNSGNNGTAAPPAPRHLHSTAGAGGPPPGPAATAPPATKDGRGALTVMITPRGVTTATRSSERKQPTRPREIAANPYNNLTDWGMQVMVSPHHHRLLHLRFHQVQ